MYLESPERKFSKVASVARTLTLRQVGPAYGFSGGCLSPLEEQRPLQVVWGILFKRLPSLVIKAGKSLHRIQELKQRYIVTHKLSGEDKTLSSIHAEVKVMRGRNFLGATVTRKEWE